MKTRLLLVFSLLVTGVSLWLLFSRGAPFAPRPPAPGEQHTAPLVRPLDSTQIVTDPGSGQEILADELIVTLAEGVSEVGFLKGLEARGIVGVRVVGRVPAGRLLQGKAGPDSIWSKFLMLLRRRGYRTEEDVRRADIYTLSAIGAESAFESRPETWVYQGVVDFLQYDPSSVRLIEYLATGQDGKHALQRTGVTQHDGRWFWGYSTSSKKRKEK